MQPAQLADDVFDLPGPAPTGHFGVGLHLGKVTLQLILGMLVQTSIQDKLAGQGILSSTTTSQLFPAAPKHSRTHFNYESDPLLEKCGARPTPV